MAPIGLGISSPALHGEKVGVGTLLAIEEYKRLAAIPTPSFTDYGGFDRESILSLYGKEAAEEIFKENERDAASGVTASMLSSRWEGIRSELAVLPDADTLRSIYLKYGICASLSDLGVDNAAANSLLDYSPSVRNRLTLMRLRKAIKADTEATKAT